MRSRPRRLAKRTRAPLLQKAMCNSNERSPNFLRPRLLQTIFARCAHPTATSDAKNRGQESGVGRQRIQGSEFSVQSFAQCFSTIGIPELGILKFGTEPDPEL